MGIFQEHPGLLFVLATILPLVSFVILLLTGAIRSWARSVRPDAPHWLEGNRPPGRMGAYIATGAIAASCILCLIGFVMFLREHAEHDPHVAAHAEVAQHDAPVVAAEPSEDRWSGRLTWASLSVKSASPKAAALQLGYKIDSLSAVMFVMVTFIATLIHIYSIGYMGDELAPVVEDNHVHTEHGHLHRRGRFARFFMFLSLFCFSMLNLILADNLFQVFLSWELVGICSYLLIGFYYERTSASNAANKAFITNRVGDAGFVVGLLILWTYVGTFNFEEIFQQIRTPVRDAHGVVSTYAGRVVRAELADNDPGRPRQHILEVNDAGAQAILFPRVQEMNPAHPQHFDGIEEEGVSVEVFDNPTKTQYSSMPYWLLVLAGLGIFLGCVGKSAQFPLQVWLPDAMEGPTPVSALIHAATMVAAGVYLVGRVYPLFTPEARLAIAYTGGITLFVAATVAIVMTDIKKVLAYSTVSQLGYMMLALGVGGWVAGLFHLVTHAFFKALLFLCSGSVIYGCHHEQEMTKMGGLYPKMKITALTMLVGVLTIAGIPLFSGWYSKDAILAQAFGFALAHKKHFLLFLLPLATAGITTFYMFRMWFMTFTGPPRDEHVHEHAHESPRTMTIPLILLAICSIAVAWGWPLWNAEKSELEHLLHGSQHVSVLAEFGYLKEIDAAWPGPMLKPEENARLLAQEHHEQAGALALGLVMLGIVFAWVLYYRRALDPEEAKEQFPGVHRFLAHKWYFDELYSVMVVRPSLVVAVWCRAFDTYVIDGTINLIGRVSVNVAKWDGRFDNGVVDGLANLIARVAYAVGGRLRRVQTGYLRSYVLFLALAAVAIFALLSYVVSAGAAK
jgi:NADH-quinone oxidoreductase subunit L